MNLVQRLLPLATLALAAPLAAGQPPARKDAPLDASFLRQYAETRGFQLGRPVQPKPTPDNKAVLFLRSEPRVPKLSLFEFDVATGKTRELLSPAQLLKGVEETLSPEEKARRERMRVSVGGFTAYQLSEDGRLVLLSLSGKLYTFDRTTGTARELKTGPGPLLDPKFAPDGSKVAYVRGQDVYAYDLAGQTESRVTTGGTEKVTHGLAEFVAQEEMDRYSGYWWSPDGKFIAYEEADSTGVETWYVADPAHPEQPPQAQPYPRPGKANVKARLGVIPVAGGETIWVEWDHARYEYLAAVRWDKKGPLTLTVQTRRQDELTLLKADPATGATTVLIAEKDPAWLNLHPEMPHWTSRHEFLWITQTREGEELDLRDGKGGVGEVLVRAAAGLSGLVAATEDGTVIAYEASTDPTQRHVRRHWRIVTHTPAAQGDEQLSHAPGLNTAVFSKDLSIYVLTTTTPGQMPKSTVCRGDGSVIGELPSVAENPSFTPAVTIEKVGPNEGFYTAVVTPHGFDPAKKYPVIVDVYGGPKHQHVLAAMRNWLLDQWLADQGFIVVAVDNRGTPGRGRDWERAIYRQFGNVPLEDQAAGLQDLAAKHPQMDLGRVGIVGWSFGGYMSALAVLKRPDVFHAAVAGAPVNDWQDYDTHYTERYLGLPATDAEGYKEGSLLTYVDKLRRPLLLVHGTADDNVYFRHTLRLADALFRAGKDFEVLPLPSLTHMVPDPVVTERLWTRIAGHFQKHLGNPNHPTRPYMPPRPPGNQGNGGFPPPTLTPAVPSPPGPAPPP
jgi:dipeptidyl-peptidase-4